MMTFTTKVWASRAAIAAIILATSGSLSALATEVDTTTHPNTVRDAPATRGPVTGRPVGRRMHKPVVVAGAAGEKRRHHHPTATGRSVDSSSTNLYSAAK